MNSLVKEKRREKTKDILNKSIDKIADTYENIQSNLNPIDIKELPNIIKRFIG